MRAARRETKLCVCPRPRRSCSWWCLSLRRTCLCDARHTFMLARVAVFDGGAVYLRPEPSEPLLRLMHMVWQRWPEMPPYGGQYLSVVPHATLAIVADEPELVMRVTEFAQPYLPIHAEAGELQLLVVRGQTWQLVHRFELA
ncbi:MAG TPA: 2'-5' RNA ligase family protein [Chloroflexota bacterium]